MIATASRFAPLARARTMALKVAIAALPALACAAAYAQQAAGAVAAPVANAANTANTAATAAASGSAVSASNLLQILLALVAVLVLMMGAAWMLRRFGIAKNMAGAPIKIVGGISVSARERIIVVEVADQWIVVGVAPGRVNTLATMPRQESGPGLAVAGTSASATASSSSSTAAAQPSFSAWLKQTIEKRNGK